MQDGYYRPWNLSVLREYDGSSYSDAGQYFDERGDTVFAKAKTPYERWRPPTPYSRYVYSGNIYTCQLNGSFIQHAPYGDSRITRTGAADCSGGYLTLIPEWPRYLEDRCVLKCRLNLKNEKINLSQNFGERAQTARLVVDSCKRIHDIVLACRRADPYGVAKALGLTRRRFRKGSPFDLWLEAQYGWKPLLSDVHGAVTLLSDHETESRPIVTVKASSSEAEYFETRPTHFVPGVYAQIIKSNRVKHECHVRLDFEPGNPVLQTAAQLGLTNPLGLAWELLPFSFVVDWFFPVGDYFSQLDATLGFVFKGGSVSRKQTLRTKPIGVNMIPDSSGFPVTGSLVAEGQGYLMKMSREPYASAPVAIPHLANSKTNASGDHVANGIALLASAFVKKVRG